MGLKIAKFSSLETELDPDVNQDEEEEKRRLINQVLELQNTLDGELRPLSE